MRRWRLAVP
jgi:hypothetical protein